jgi:hypothetical protein
MMIVSSRSATAKPGFITICEVFTTARVLTEAESLPGPDEISEKEKHLFLPTLSRVAFSLPSLLAIMHVRTSKHLMKSTCREDLTSLRVHYHPTVCFSPVGALTERFMLGWSPPVGYTPHKKILLTSRSASPGPPHSPIVIPKDPTIH